MTNIPQFTLCKENPPTTLIHAFLHKMVINCKNPPPTLKSNAGAVYQAVYEDFIIPDLCDAANCNVIVSFQKHAHGMYAVVRNLKQTTKE